MGFPKDKNKLINIGDFFLALLGILYLFGIFVLVYGPRPETIKHAF